MVRRREKRRVSTEAMVNPSSRYIEIIKLVYRSVSPTRAALVRVPADAGVRLRLAA